MLDYVGTGRHPCNGLPSPNGGFTKHDKSVAPVIDFGPFGYQHVNAADQRRDPHSMLNWTGRMIRMRKEVPKIGWGISQSSAPASTASSDFDTTGRDNSVLFVHNLAATPREFFRLRCACRPGHRLDQPPLK